jgi:phosphopantothenoylcysteine synthetase/decarboxylase
MSSSRVMYVIACGGRPAADLPRFVTWAKDLGWDVCVIATPSGMKFLDAGQLAELTSHPVRSDYKQPEDPDVLPFPPDMFLVAPATFNTVNKWAAGISDTLALGLLNEALCSGSRIVAAPFPNKTLAQHPAFQRSLAVLRDCGVRLVFDTGWLPTPNLGEQSRDLFPWATLQAEVAERPV